MVPLKTFIADLHIHTCLSPCTEIDMTPKTIVRKSRERGIDIIAICDHNSVENAEAVIEAAGGSHLQVLPGMEICSKEEVHILAIFDEIQQAYAMQEYVYDHLPGINRPEYFGNQIRVSPDGDILGENPKLLIGATELSVEEIVEKTHALNGLSIASHVDRTGFGMIQQLGFIPEGLPLDSVEVSWRITIPDAKKKYSDIRDYPCITSSDAHYPSDIGKAHTIFLMDSGNTQEIRMAMREVRGRKIITDESDVS